MKIEEARKILNVSDSDSIQTIKKAYYTLAKKYHPDKNLKKRKRESEESFQELSNAYDLLVNQIKLNESSRNEEGIKKPSSKNTKNFFNQRNNPLNTWYISENNGTHIFLRHSQHEHFCQPHIIFWFIGRENFSITLPMKSDEKFLLKMRHKLITILPWSNFFGPCNQVELILRDLNQILYKNEMKEILKVIYEEFKIPNELQDEIHQALFHHKLIFKYDF